MCKAETSDISVLWKKDEKVNGTTVHRECMDRQVGSANGARVLDCGEIHLLVKTSHGLKKKIKWRERSQSTAKCRYGRPLVFPLVWHRGHRPNSSAISVLCVVSGSRREADENRALLGYYAASSGNSLSTFRDFLADVSGPTYPETPIRNYHHSRNIPEECGSHCILWSEFAQRWESSAKCASHISRQLCLTKCWRCNTLDKSYTLHEIILKIYFIRDHEEGWNYFYRCTMDSDIYVQFTHQKMHFY